MCKIHEYIEALKKEKGYEWMCQNGHDLNKDDLIRIIKEFDYAIHSMESCDGKEDLYDAVYCELVDWYGDDEEE